jgi:hypothetical protein
MRPSTGSSGETLTPAAPDHSQAALEARIRAISRSLRETFGAVTRAIGGSSARPSRLTRELSIDKSLASRLSRALRAESDYELLSLIPSPTGLRIVVGAAVRAGVERQRCHAAEEALEEFQGLLDDVPGGRAALEALFSGTVVEARDRHERVAKQAVFRGMSHLLGFHCDVLTSAAVLAPSVHPHLVDGVDLSLRVGLRRLRPSAPISLFSVVINTEGAGGELPHIETLDGRPASGRAAPFLLPEFSSRPTPALDIHEHDNHTIFALADEGTSIHRPVKIASGIVARSAWPRFRAANMESAGRLYLLHYPCKMVVRDLFIHESLYVGSLPEIRLELPVPPGAPLRFPRGAMARLNTLDLLAPIEQLGIGLARAAVPGAPDHAPLLEHAFRQVRWDPSAFRGYRVAIAYPVPMISMHWQVELPAPPGSRGS